MSLAIKHHVAPEAFPLLVSRQLRGSAKAAEAKPFSGTYSDDRIAVIWSWSYLQSTPTFVLENKSGANEEIRWNEAAFIDAAKLTHRVFHKDVSYIQRNVAMPNTVVASGARVADTIMPIDAVHWERGGWVESPIITTADSGQKVSVLLPIDAGGATHDYIFTFQVRPEPHQLDEAKRIDALRSKAMDLIHADMTMDEVRAVLGEPDETAHLDTGGAKYVDLIFRKLCLTVRFSAKDGHLITAGSNGCND